MMFGSWMILYVNIWPSNINSQNSVFTVFKSRHPKWQWKLIIINV